MKIYERGIIFIEPYPFSDLSFSIGAISCREKPAYDGLGNGSHDIPWKSRVSGKNIGFCATIMNAGGFHSLPAFFPGFGYSISFYHIPQNIQYMKHVTTYMTD